MYVILKILFVLALDTCLRDHTWVWITVDSPKLNRLISIRIKVGQEVATSIKTYRYVL